ncbi:hypothetical protein [Streptomyces sp. NPDC001435]|uniref:hypothetical protein n=1 Tax=unclassified Streptomyces TaxID=2593676 RepID=UPI0036995F38
MTSATDPHPHTTVTPDPPSEAPPTAPPDAAPRWSLPALIGIMILAAVLAPVLHDRARQVKKHGTAVKESAYSKTTTSNSSQSSQSSQSGQSTVHRLDPSDAC